MISQELIDNMAIGRFDEDLLEFEEMTSLDVGIDEEIEAGESLMEDGNRNFVIDELMMKKDKDFD